jgi:nitrogen PTS system EIIA component
MEMAQLIDLKQVINLRVTDKAQLLQELSRRAAKQLGVNQDTISQALAAREDLGSTGVGKGIAVPHARIAGLDRFFSMFAHLEKPIDFVAVDHLPVDLVFLLLIPEGMAREHLAALAAISRTLRDPKISRRLRKTCEPSELYAVLTGAI